MNRAPPLLSIAMCAWLAGPGWSNQAAILQIRILEGEGIVHAAGSRASRPLTLRVTDETGKPVEGAAVSFRLPDNGPSGVFASGLKSELALTDPEGKASVRGIRWNRTSGSIQIRITASKGQARAGMLATAHITDQGPAAQGSKLKWILLGVAGAGAGGLAYGLSRRDGTSSGAGPPRIGVPVITVGAP